MNEVLLKTIIAEFAKQSSNILKDLKGEATHFFDDGLANYLEKQRTKFIKVKTLLHRTTPIPFYDVYLPTRLSCKTTKIETNSINKVFWESQFITIIGDAGSGKSTLIKHLFLNSIAEKFCIPILIELRYLNDFKGSLEDYIREKIFDNRLSPNEKILSRLLDNGKFVFFLDGYDEIKSDFKEQIVEKLNTFIDKYRLNRFMLTTRPYSNVELLPLFHNYKIEKLNDNEIKRFISIQKIEEELSQKIIKSVSENKVIYLKSYLTNPLLLSLYILTFSTNSSIPNKKYIFYRRVLDVLFKEHDSISKIGYERELLTKLSQEEFEEILEIFSFISYFENEYDFTKDYLYEILGKIKKKRTSFKFDNNELIEDLKSAIALWTEDSGVYAFAHRSMQEYFAALYVKGINDDKRLAYSRIQDKLFSGKKRGETFNFLSLCEEMDSYNYRKYMLLPALQFIRTKINSETDDSLLSTTLAFFFNILGIAIKNEKPSGVHLSLKRENAKYLFAIEKFEHLLVNDLFDISKEKQVADYTISLNKKEKNPENEHLIYHLSLKKLSPEGLKILSKTKILKTANEFSDYLDIKIKEIGTFINETDKSEKDFIDLI